MYSKSDNYYFLSDQYETNYKKYSDNITDSNNTYLPISENPL